MGEVAIVGGGLVGSLLSIYLAKRNFQVHVYERRPDSRKLDQVGGRSINLALSRRGWKALEEVGIDQEIREIALPMEGRMIHAEDGTTVFQPYGKEGEAIYSVSREGLNQALDRFSTQMDNVHYHYSTSFLRTDRKTGQISLKNELDGTEFDKNPDVVFGTDGAFSKVRSFLMRRKRFNYEQAFLDHGYKELCIPAAADGGWQIANNALHIWPRKSFMLIALPNLDGSFTCTLFLSFEGEESFEKLQTPEAVQAFFEREFADALPLMPNLVEDFFDNPTDSLVTIRCFPWAYEDKFLMMGDASHAIVPFYGQGMNSGFEDCRVFNDVLNNQSDVEFDWRKVFTEYEDLRKPDADAIAELALRNFIEMRDSVADPKFLIRKQLEKKLMAGFPHAFTPTYSLVTFTEDIRYSEALRKANVQNALFSNLMKDPQFIEKWEKDGFESELPQIVEQYQSMLASG